MLKGTALIMPNGRSRLRRARRGAGRQACCVDIHVDISSNRARQGAPSVFLNRDRQGAPSVFLNRDRQGARSIFLNRDRQGAAPQLRSYPFAPSRQPHKPAITNYFPPLSPLDSSTSHFGPHPFAQFLGYLETEEIGARPAESRFH
jgi:hypothetical protein